MSGAEPRAPSIGCQVCGTTTRGGKPYCSAHVHKMPRIRCSILPELKARAAELAGEPIRPQSSLVLDTQAAYEAYVEQYGAPPTLARLAQDANLPKNLVLEISQALNLNLRKRRRQKQ